MTPSHNKTLSTRLKIIIATATFFIAGAIIIKLCTSCNSGSKNELVYISYERPDNLIPIFNMNEESKYLSELLFDGLVNKTTLNDKGMEQYQWALVAEDGYMEESPDNRFLISIYLKKGIQWHNGEELTSRDVLYTWNAIQQSDSPLKGWLSSFVEEISLVEGDNYKFKIKLKVERSREAFMELFAPVKILPHFILEKENKIEMPHNLNAYSDHVNNYKWNVIGTGPYKLEDREAESIILKANDKYCTGKPAIGRISYQAKNDRIMAVKALSSNQHSILFDVNPESFGVLAEDALVHQTYVPYSFYIIAYNTQEGPFRDINFRKAINSSTDKTELAKAFFEDVTMNSEDYVNTSIFPSHSRYVKSYPLRFTESTPYDDAKADTYMKLAANNPKSFNLLVSSAVDGDARINRFISEYIQQMEAQGISVTINDVSSPVYYQQIRDRSFDAVLINLNGFDHFYDIRGLFKPGGERNIWGVNDNRLNEELVEFGETISWDKLIDITASIHSRIEELAPGCFIFTVPRRSYFSDEITGITIHPEVGFSTVENWKFVSK